MFCAVLLHAAYQSRRLISTYQCKRRRNDVKHLTRYKQTEGDLNGENRHGVTKAQVYVA